MSATLVGVAPSDECLRGEGLVWLVQAVVCLLAALWVQFSISVGNGWLHTVL